MSGLDFWSGGLAAFAFTALAIWRHRRGDVRRAPDKALIVALLLTAMWGVSIALAGAGSSRASLMETFRNMGWLAFLYTILRRIGKAPATIGALIGVLLFVLMGLMMWDLIRDQPIGLLEAGLRMLFATGALVLVHNLYHLTGARRQDGMALALATLAAIWTYDLGLYLFVILPGYGLDLLLPARGIVLAMMAPLLAIALRDSARWRFALSHQAAFRFASVGVIALYLGIAVLLATLAGRLSGVAGLAIMFMMSLAALPIIPSDRLRARIKVLVAKHFFRHRYDYRTEWMRFVDMVGAPEGTEMQLGARVAKALSDVLESRAGLVLLRSGETGFRVSGRWNWDGDAPGEFAREAITLFEAESYIADCNMIRAGGDSKLSADWLPAAIVKDDQVHAIVPLVHLGRLVGLALLGRPPLERTLDWEDIDILRAAGFQAASYLAEAEGQARLVETRQFDEFNRRFAFVMHDIKNVVSQLGLTARNAERHAENPEFRADMIATLKGSVAKMQDLLARLDGKGPAAPPRPRAILLTAMLRELVPLARPDHMLSFEDVPQDLAVRADPDRLRSILSHLIQNAVEASPAGSAIYIRAAAKSGQATVQLIDRGCGMDEAFLSDGLFRPFKSSKTGGFGIGAYEARMLARSMDGELSATSRLGEGSIFTLRLPAADTVMKKEAA